jgi:hypothetical protein
MLKLSAVLGLFVCTSLLGAPSAEALPVSFTIGHCVSGDCAAFDVSNRGSIDATIEQVNGNDLLITVENNLNADAVGDEPFLAYFGFQYGGLLSGLTLDNFTVLSGIVGTPTFLIDSSISAFAIDFGFAFSQGRGALRDGRFQANDPNELVQILVGTTGTVDLDNFSRGFAKIGGAGDNGASGAIVLTGGRTATVPEPGSLMLLLIGAGIESARRRRSAA